MMNTGMYMRKVAIFYTTNLEIWKVLAVALSALISILINVIVPLLVLLVLILIDMRFGIKKYVKRKNEQGEKLKSNATYKNVKSYGIRRTLAKLADYLFFILVVIAFELLLEHLKINVHFQNVYLSTLTVLLLCIVELKSIDENFRELQGISIMKHLVNFVFRKKSVSEIVNEEMKDENK